MVDELEVSLDVGHKPRVVGRLVYSHRDQRSLFEYDRAFLGSGYSLSPIQLPLEEGVFRADRLKTPDDHLYGLHGVFADSLPDTWGRRVQDLWFQRIGIDSPHPFDRLTYIGDHGMGALTYKPSLAFKDIGTSVTALSQLRKAAMGVVKGDVSSVTARLSRIGGSAGGMYPKYLVNFNPLTRACTYGVPPVEGEVAAIVKIPLKRGDEAQKIEYAYARMACDAKISMTPTYLVHQGTMSYYFIQRFDVSADGSRNHTHTLAGMLGINYADRIIDYRQAFRLTHGLTRDKSQLEQLYRRIAFNVLSCNRDDHAKNLSFLMDKNGVWTLSPAYDLTYVASSGQGHAMSLNGVVAGHTLAVLETVAQEFDVKHWMRCTEEVIAAVSRWPEHADAARVTPSTIAAIGADMARVRDVLQTG